MNQDKYQPKYKHNSAGGAARWQAPRLGGKAKQVAIKNKKQMRKQPH